MALNSSYIPILNMTTVFRPYPFTIGEKIYIDGGRRHGDWEVIAVSADTVTLRCPVSGREFEWNRFCYFVEKSGRN